MHVHIQTTYHDQIHFNCINPNYLPLLLIDDGNGWMYLSEDALSTDGYDGNGWINLSVDILSSDGYDGNDWMCLSEDALSYLRLCNLPSTAIPGQSDTADLSGMLVPRIKGFIFF